MVTIRPMTRGDIPAAAETEKQCFSSPWSPESFESAMSAGSTVFFAAECRGAFAGYGGIQIFPPEGAITNIALCPKYRRQGIGKMILDGIIDYCASHGIMEITLEVRRSNAAAVALYEKSGFEIIGERKRFYSKPVEDALIMRRPSD